MKIAKTSGNQIIDFKPKMLLVAYTNIRAKINCRIAIKIEYLKNSNRPIGLFIFNKFSNCINSQNLIILQAFR